MEALQQSKIPMTRESPVVIAIDMPVVKTRKGKTTTTFERGFFLCKGGSLINGDPVGFARVWAHDVLSERHQGFFAALEREGSSERVMVILYPTRTYSEGFGGHMFSDLAPEDRRMIRKVMQRYQARTDCYQVHLKDTNVFPQLAGFLQSDEEKAKYRDEKETHAERRAQAAAPKTGLVEFDLKFLTGVKEIFKSCMTRPNRQDFFYLATKTFGVNLAVRTAFAAKGVLHGDLPLMRAVLATSWYQIQDIVFTIFGQTYMKFLGRMTGMFRVYRAYIGDFMLVYFQFCFLEFLNRLILGPIGENPLAYTWKGLALIFINNLQGLISGGPLVPAINKIRKAGVISHSMMMHMYQLGSLCFYFGLFASFGYQRIYFLLTTSVMVFAWGSYLVFSTYFKDPVFVAIEDGGMVKRLDAAAAGCYSV